MVDTKIYLLIKDKVAVDTNYKIIVNDLADVYCSEKQLKAEVENTIIYETKDNEDWKVISSITIIEKIIKKNPNLDIEIIGSDEVLIEIKTREKERKIFIFLKVTVVFILVFFGAGFTIMNFHTDVDMEETMRIINQSLTGNNDSNPLLLTISYSIGLGLGVIIFFNRMISRSQRRKKEPGPMEIELYNYDKEMEEYILNEINKSSEE
ncbi:MAG TPA: stage V sporulation protein AA [Tissierellaceae bacterium]|nr:stage V sporulation protein AA [Tissierellaceae bacterium]